MTVSHVSVKSAERGKGPTQNGSIMNIANKQKEISILKTLSMKNMPIVSFFKLLLHISESRNVLNLTLR